VSAATVAKTPRLSERISRAPSPVPADFTLSKPLRVMTVTRPPVLIALAKAVRGGSATKYRSLNSAPVGSAGSCFVAE